MGRDESGEKSYELRVRSQEKQEAISIVRKTASVRRKPLGKKL